MTDADTDADGHRNPAICIQSPSHQARKESSPIFMRCRARLMNRHRGGDDDDRQGHDLTPSLFPVAGGQRARAAPQEGRVDGGRGHVLQLQDCNRRTHPRRGSGPRIFGTLCSAFRLSPPLPARAPCPPGYPLPGKLNLTGTSLSERLLATLNFLLAESVRLHPVEGLGYR